MIDHLEKQLFHGFFKPDPPRFSQHLQPENRNAPDDRARSQRALYGKGEVLSSRAGNGASLSALITCFGIGSV